MKLVSVVAAFSVLVLAVASFAGAASASLRTFASGGNTVTVTSPSSATIVTTNDQDAGVYVQGKSLQGKALAKVDFEFTSTGAVAGGAPRFSIPVGTNGLYAFLDAANCGGASEQTTLVSTNSSSCQVFFDGVMYANWDAFASANPTLKIRSNIPFIIADGTPGTYVVTGIDLH